MALRVIVAGGRDFDYYILLEKKLNYYFKDSEVHIISGGANGADKLGEKYARANCLVHTVYPANWLKYGKAAGHVRSERMAQNADALVAFWDGKSKGTSHMIETAKKYNLKIRIVRYEREN